jgi:flagellar biosynthesis protein FliR
MRVKIEIETQWVMSVLLVAVRMAALLWATPLFSIGNVPARVRLILTLVFSAGIVAIQPMARLDAEPTLIGFAGAAFIELAVGLLMAFGLHCAFGAFSFGGRLLDLQMGLGVASLINPSSSEQEPLLGTVLLVVGVMTFFLLGGHHAVATALVQSYGWFPLGKPITNLEPGVIVAQFGLMFSLGTVLVAPVVAVLLLLDAGLAMAAKTMPQMNVFMISIPVKIVVGVLMLAALSPLLSGIFRSIFESIFTYWRALAR